MGITILNKKKDMEIKPQELRLNNLVEWNKEACTVQSIRGNDIGLYDLNKALICTTTKLIKPIELTPEWLERFGFEYEKQTIGGFERWEIKTAKGRRIKLLDKKFTWGVGEYSDYILHVHQIQNLYFALTGEELAIDKTSLKN